MRTIRRLWRHWVTTPWRARRYFPAPVLAAIAAAIRACEAQHAGEIRVVIEAAWPLPRALRGGSARDRALEVFARCRVWDTEYNNGVLLYVLLAERAVELVADRGVAGGRVPQQEWDAVCAQVAGHFRAGAFEQGAVAGVQAIADVLARYPAGPGGATAARNELPDTPLLM